jgi:glycosyltransferase involved in cell wall biosynthesis
VPDITVAICTWNRAALLDQTLAAMHGLRIPAGVTWELLVVNNKCTDDTDTVIARHSSALPIRRLFEPERGHSMARNCAVAAATGELLAWTDDDVLVDPEWLVAYVRAAADWPRAAFFGGTIDPWFSVEPPTWVRDHLAEFAFPFAIRQLGPETRPLGASESPFGANMAFRTELLRRFPFNPRLGRRGSVMVSGDESSLFRQMRAAGHAGVWVGSARVRHFIPVERLSARFLRRWYEGAGMTHVRMEGLPPGVRYFRVPRHMVRQYLTERAKALVFGVHKGKPWVRAFKSAAMVYGMMRESRSLAEPSALTR